MTYLWMAEVLSVDVSGCHLDKCYLSCFLVDLYVCLAGENMFG